jgi:phenylacetate-CoA ligase
VTKRLATALVAGALFPLHERLKGHDTLARLRALERSQWQSSEAIEALQAEGLRAFLAAVARNVPYYGNLFAEYGFDPLRVRTPADLTSLPLLDKARIRANRDAMIARTARGLKRYNTGGSSGEPLVFYVGRDRVSHDVAAKWRATRWWDVDIGDREIVVWGSPIELGAQDRARALRDRLFRTTLLPAFEMSDANLDRFVDAIRAARPRMLFGYPSAIAHIARHARARGRRMDDLGIRVAFVTSERLYDDQKADIESVFACRTANGYGGRDAGFIAHECPCGGMHVSAEDIVVEVVDSEGRRVPSGDSGEIVVTHLATGDFPFIRYRTGDIGALDPAPCACGRGLPLLMEISGRSTDFVVARDGTIMHGLALIYTVRDLPGIEQFRIVQHDLDRTEVQLVASPEFTGAHEQRIVGDFRARLGVGVDVRITRVPRIAPEPSGKFRYVVSHVQTTAAGASAKVA